MKKLWVFGDSNSEGYNEQYHWVTPYLEHKGYKPKWWSELVSEELGMELLNRAKGGTDNYTIFESVCKEVNNIKTNDVIVIGWSSILRNRIIIDAFEKDTFLTIVPNSEYHYDYFCNQCIQEMVVNRDSQLYVDEVMNWMKLIRKAFTNNKVLCFSSWPEFLNEKNIINGNWWKHGHHIMTIDAETNGKLNDGHFSEAGCRVLADILKQCIESNDKLI
jgi:hypothetical protein